MSVAGRLIRGAEQFSTDSFGEWVVGQGYRQVCGDAGAWGDGITPVEAALLPGAEHVVLENVYHSPIGAGAGAFAFHNFFHFVFALTRSIVHPAREIVVRLARHLGTVGWHAVGR